MSQDALLSAARVLARGKSSRGTAAKRRLDVDLAAATYDAQCAASVATEEQQKAHAELDNVTGLVQQRDREIVALQAQLAAANFNNAELDEGAREVAALAAIV